MGQLGTDPTTLTDCSDVLPAPPDLKTEAHFPAGKTLADVQAAVRLASFVIKSLHTDFDGLPVC